MPLLLASLRKKPRSPYWFACIQLARGRRTQRSTKLTDRAAALKLARRWEAEARAAAPAEPEPAGRRPDFTLGKRPQRIYLSTQMVAALRHGIERGTWREFLPSERRLSETLGVSRPTVRTAIHLLAQEGLLEIRRGRRNRILPAAPGGQRRSRRLVAIVMQQQISVLSLDSYHVISEMRTHLAERGFESEMFFCTARSPAAQRRSLEAFVRENRVFCCVLLSVRREVQQWIASHAVPALVVGSCHASVRLPSLDLDHRSMGRHAGGFLLGKGHRRFGLIVTDVGMGGDLASEEGFRESVEPRVAANEATLAVVHASGSALEINRKLDIVFNSARAPTALFVLQPKIVAIVLIYLLRRGLRVPEDVSLISRDPEKLFLALHPPIAHYSFEVKTFNHRLSRLMARMVSHGRLPAEPNLVVPQFMAGGTVAPPPPSSARA